MAAPFFNFYTMLTPEQKTKLEEIEKIRNRESRYAYYGILKEYHLNLNHINRLDYSNLNSHQRFLFKRVLHGLNIYTQEDISKMHYDKVNRIKRVWMKGQKILNEWKQVISSKQINYFLYSTFGNKVKAIIDIPAEETLPDYRNNLRLKDLGIRYEDVILKFMSEGLLPKNFLTLDEKVFKKKIQA